jgi:hypothetical protein
MQEQLSEGWIAELKKQNEDLAAMVTKWRPRILSLATKLARNMGDEFEDVVQDFLQKMWTDIEYFKQPQVRYLKGAKDQKGIWEVVASLENEMFHLRRTAHGKTQEIFLKRSETEEIKKASMGTFIYAGLRQYYLDRLSSHHTARNGYAVNEEDPATKRTVASGKVKSFPNYHKISGVVATPHLHSEDGTEVSVVDLAPSYVESPEEEVIYSDLVLLVRSRISSEAKRLLDFMLMIDEEFLVFVDLEILRQQVAGEDIPKLIPKLDDASAAKHLSKTREEIRRLRMEIIESLPSDFLTYPLMIRTSSGEYKRTEPVRKALEAH